MTRKTLAAISRLNKEQKGARRVNNIVARLRGLDTDGQRFSVSAEALLRSTREKTGQMRDRERFPNTVQGLRRVFKELGVYLSREKPPKSSEKVKNWTCPQFFPGKLYRRGRHYEWQFNRS